MSGYGYCIDEKRVWAWSDDNYYYYASGGSQRRWQYRYLSCGLSLCVLV